VSQSIDQYRIQQQEGFKCVDQSKELCEAGGSTVPVDQPGSPVLIMRDDRPLGFQSKGDSTYRGGDSPGPKLHLLPARRLICLARDGIGRLFQH
jgi:hypothetical protein